MNQNLKKGKRTSEIEEYGKFVEEMKTKYK